MQESLAAEREFFCNQLLLLIPAGKEILSGSDLTKKGRIIFYGAAS
jgi:hypothetical protein